MRASFIVLAVATLAAIASGDQAFGSIIAPDQTQLTEHQDISSPKRFLRHHKNHDNVDDEERAKFNYEKFSRMNYDEAYRNKRFYNWKYTRKWSDRKVSELLKADNYPLMRSLFYKWQTYNS
ncbi:RxLR effector protein [Phytophthora megakarya]|uniref:RxLR effector protein n=1 Tax=Phytophthora megakarya TaxID=4795 RepID=A0A225VFP6_9STRA|nr:RxLR effector protein [Phytophthora megakarya]